MSLTLTEAANLTTDTLVKGVIEAIVQASPVLDRMPLKEIQGNAFRYNTEATLPGVAWRAINEAYVESTGTVNPTTEALYRLGGDADVDRFIAQTQSNINDQRAVQTAMKVKSLSLGFQDSFFNGDSAVDPDSIDGLKTRLIGDQVISAGVDGFIIDPASATSAKRFFALLDEVLAAAPGANAIYTNSKILGLARACGREINQDIAFEDINSKRTLVWQGIPLLDAGETPAGVQVLPFGETVGASADCSSLYAVKFGMDESDAGLTGLTNGGVNVRDLGEIDSKPVYRTRIELYVGMALFGGRAAARLSGLRKA